MKIKLRKHRYLLFYLCLSIAIMLPLFRPGYILTLDMAFGPNPDLIARLYGLNEWWVPMLGAQLSILCSELCSKSFLTCILTESYPCWSSDTAQTDFPSLLSNLCH